MQHAWQWKNLLAGLVPLLVLIERVQYSLHFHVSFVDTVAIFRFCIFSFHLLALQYGQDEDRRAKGVNTFSCS